MLVARAWKFKAIALSEGRSVEQAVDVYRTLIRRFRRSDHPDEKEACDLAMNGIAYHAILCAKRSLRGGQRSAARNRLNSSQQWLKKLLEREPAQRLLSFALGNLAYACFLLGDIAGSRKRIRQAIALGGEELRTAELRDTRLHPVAEDPEFRTILRSVPSPSSQSRLRTAIRRIPRRG
jgi:tetratricopeptide (TPR) repeat protein